MGPDLILLNGNVRTMDPMAPRASALVFRAGEVIYVGDDSGALDLRQRTSVILDARGALVLPGLTDSHLHFCGFAQSLDRVDLAGCRSLEEAAARVAARAAKARPGENILGSGWNHLDWQGPVWPDRFSLDAVAPLNPVVLTRKDGHSAWINTAALKAFGLTRETRDPEGGRLERDADGEPTGIVRENALSLLDRAIGQTEDEVSEDALERAINYAHGVGLTGIHNIEGANALRAWQRLNSRGKLKLRVVHALPDVMLEHALTLGIMRGLGDEYLRVQAIKMFADGSLGSQTAEMFDPFVGSAQCGMILTASDVMLRTARTAALAGLDVWTHAIGDAAIARTLTVYETLRAEGITDAILRIEHVQHPRPVDLNRFRAANVIASVQPIHQPADMQMADQFLGRARARYTYAFNSLRLAGATLAFGSDCPVESLDPLLGIYSAVTRQNRQGEPPDGWFPQERITVEQAIEGYTVGAAAAAGDLDRAGTLAVGKRADAVVLSADIFEHAPDEILKTRVGCTIVGGEVVHLDPELVS